MKFKSKLLAIVSVISFIIVIALQTISNADTPSVPVYFGITELRTSTNTGYAMKEPGYGGMKVWNILKYASSTDTNPQELASYCLKAGVGFRNTGDKEQYTKKYDLLTEKAKILSENSSNTVITGLVNNDQYYNILSVLDLMYVPNKPDTQTAEAYKTTLLNAAGITYTDQESAGYFTFKLTDDDIESVQQQALWYFTNYKVGDESLYNQYDESLGTNWIYYTTNGTDYSAFAGYGDMPASGDQADKEGVQRDLQSRMLYNYLIKTAQANANNYKTQTEIGVPITIDKSKVTYTQDGTNYKIGPIHITKNNDLPYDIDATVKNGDSQISYKILNSAGQEVTNIKDLEGQDFYISVASSGISTIKIDFNVTYNKTAMDLYLANSADTQPVVILEKTKETVPTSIEVTPEGEYDLALIKFITKVNNVAPVVSREPKVSDLDKLAKGEVTTATYTHPKTPLAVETGDTVLYTIRVYNEGDTNGKVGEIVDYLPTGLTLKENSTINTKYGWTSETDTYGTKVKTTYLKDTTLKAFNKTASPLKLDYADVEVECTVVAQTSDTNTKLKNIAEITKDDGDDRDSTPDNVKKDNYGDKSQEDDDDFEDLILNPKYFDLKLVKRITEVNSEAVEERIQNVDVSPLVNGTNTTANYTLNKDPITVKTGDIVKYTFRVYNEGDVDGYAQKVRDDLPEGLQFLYSTSTTDEDLKKEGWTEDEIKAIKYNQDYYWGYVSGDTTLKNIETTYLSKESSTDNLIKAFDKEKVYVDSTTDKNPDYREVSVMLKVTAANTSGTKIRNEAEISEDYNESGIKDRDSSPDYWEAKDNGKYEDDEDYDNIVLQSFDLSLRKFITAVSHDETVEDSEYLKNTDGTYKRAPIVDTSKLNTTGEDGKIITTATYNHTKAPIEVTINDTVIYMLRIYNEGETDGYAAEIKDHLPPYLQFVEGDFNKEYGWTVSTDGRTVTTTYLKDSLVKKAQASKEGENLVLSYVEVPIMCKVSNEVQSNYKITNIADITKYEDSNHNPVIDRDSSENNLKVPSDENYPSYKDDETGAYIPGQEDDDDFEKVIVKIFDLALRKWVTEAIVIEDGVETVTQTGHDPWDDPEDIVKVEINRKKLNTTTVKFRFSIRVINQGDIAGYAKEVTDYIPEGLEFIQEENPSWTDEGNNIISTRALENTLLQPGEYADVDVLLTWINNESNIQVMTNVAEISEDYNDKGIPDIDSIPDNKKAGEDDIDDAPVLVSISTGQARIYFTLGFIVLVTAAGGVVLIKKYVL